MLRSIFAGLLIAANLLAVSIGAGGERILCVRSDGHVAIEMATAVDDCCASIKEHPLAAAHLKKSALKRDSCIDIPLNTRTALTDVRSRTSLHATAVLWMLPAAPVLFDAPSSLHRTPLPSCSDPAPPALSALATIVLLV